MQTVFALFQRYEDARSAADDLLGRDFTEAEMNVVVSAPAAKEYLRLTRHVPHSREHDLKSRSLGGQSLFGLDSLLAGEQPVQTPDSGSLLVGGEMASALVKSAPGVESSLRHVLSELGLDEGTVEAAAVGVQTGRILFWVRCPDERAGVAATVYRRWHAQRVAAGGIAD